MSHPERFAVAGNPFNLPDMNSEKAERKAVGASLSRNALINLVGQGLPMLVALLAIPLLIAELGTERFGVLTLAWVMIGYLSLFDLGLGLALTKVVAEKLGAGREEDTPELVWTTLLLMVLLGVLGTAIVSVIAPWIVQEALQIPDALQPEALKVLFLLAFSLPWVISTAGLRGVLEANQRFDLVNAIRLPLGVFTYLGPLLVLPFLSGLVPIIAVLVGGRILAWLAHLLLCLRALPLLRQNFAIRFGAAGPLLRFGGWMTVSNVISPLMVYFDRFFIGALVSMTAVAYYVTPYEAVTRLLLFPAALIGVLFPAFASSFPRDPNHTNHLFDRGVRIIFVLVFPLALVLVTLSSEVLTLWLGSDVARNSTTVLQWLTVGVFINSLAQAPFAVLQGIGRPDLTAKLHLAELPLYSAALWWFVQAWGIQGAALAWALRVALDAALLFALANRALPSGLHTFRRAGMLLGAGVLTLAIATVPDALGAKIGFLAGTLIVFSLLGWRFILHPDERVLLRAVSAGAKNLVSVT